MIGSDMTKIPPKKRKTSVSSLRLIARKLKIPFIVVVGVRHGKGKPSRRKAPKRPNYE